MLVPQNVLAALLSHCDQESSRYALGAIQLERTADGKPIAIATDGRRLIAYTWPEPESHPHMPKGEVKNLAFSALIAGSAIKQIKGWKLNLSKHVLSRHPELSCVYIPETRDTVTTREGDDIITRDVPLSVSATDLEANYKIDRVEMDGRFPKWRDVFPSYINPEFADDSTAITLDPKLLAEACDVARKIGTSEGSVGVTLTIPHNSDRPAILRSRRCSGERMAVVLMPLCADQDVEKGIRADVRGWRPGYVPTVRTEAEELEYRYAVVEDLRGKANVAAAFSNRMAELSAREHDGPALDEFLLKEASQDAREKANKLSDKLQAAQESLAELLPPIPAFNPDDYQPGDEVADSITEELSHAA